MSTFTFEIAETRCTLIGIRSQMAFKMLYNRVLEHPAAAPGALELHTG